MVIKYTNIFHSNALQNKPKLVFLVLKYIYHLATLAYSDIIDGLYRLCNNRKSYRSLFCPPKMKHIPWKKCVLSTKFDGADFRGLTFARQFFLKQWMELLNKVLSFFIVVHNWAIEWMLGCENGCSRSWKLTFLLRKKSKNAVGKSFEKNTLRN
jgi:hypothetical protein